VAALAPPNSVRTLVSKLPHSSVVVEMVPCSTACQNTCADSPGRTFVVAERAPGRSPGVAPQRRGGDQLPPGRKPARHRALARLSRCRRALVSCIRCSASDPRWARSSSAVHRVIGDDTSQLATIVRALAQLFADRGVVLDRTYQLNVGGNTDFLGMLNHERTASSISKTEAVQSVLPHPLEAEQIHIGPSDYVAWQRDNKVCFLRMEGRGFGNAPLEIELRLSVQDSPNSAGCVIDAIRCCRVARDRGVGGALVSPSSYLMKHPPQQLPDAEARDDVERFLRGELAR
jgi:myo-inositol-1-phosphate synthase